MKKLLLVALIVVSGLTTPVPARAVDYTQVAMGTLCSLGGAGIALLGQVGIGPKRGYGPEAFGGMVILAGLYQICKGFGLNFRSPIA